MILSGDPIGGRSDDRTRKDKCKMRDNSKVLYRAQISPDASLSRKRDW